MFNIKHLWCKYIVRTSIILILISTSGCSAIKPGTTIKENTFIAGYKASTVYLQVARPINAQTKDIIFGVFPVIFPSGNYMLASYYIQNNDGSTTYIFDSPSGVRWKGFNTFGKYVTTAGNLHVKVAHNKIIHIQGVYAFAGGEGVMIPESSYDVVRIVGR